MRSKHFFIGLASCVSVACAIFAGCSSSSSDDTAAPGPDSGPDVTAVDAAPDVAKDSAPVDTGPEACAVDADLATLPVPDASLGDSGATAPECVACVKTMCPALLPKCQASCACVTAFVSFEQCIATGESLITCATSDLLNGNAGLGESDLIPCALGCETPCGVTNPTPDGGGDGSTDGAAADGDDGSADAAGE